MKTKHNWALEEIKSIYQLPFFDLLHRAMQTHQTYFRLGEIQVSQLVSIKTGSCPEDCAYCPQSSRYKTNITKHPLKGMAYVIKQAESAKKSGASRVCLGAAWKNVQDGKGFDDVLQMVRQISSMGMEVCCTLGMLTEKQALQLKDAGLYAYNHNIDTSEEYYHKIITTRTYQDRLETLQHVRNAGMTVCCGGILGMGESIDDRLQMIQTLASMPKHPESIPINTLVPIEGTPLQDREEVPVIELARTIATARVIMPQSMIRLSAGRLARSLSDQALCFIAGANSIFSGEKLLTTANPKVSFDKQMFNSLNITKMVSKNATD